MKLEQAFDLNLIDSSTNDFSSLTRKEKETVFLRRTKACTVDGMFKKDGKWIGHAIHGITGEDIYYEIDKKYLNGNTFYEFFYLKDSKSSNSKP